MVSIVKVKQIIPEEVNGNLIVVSKNVTVLAGFSHFFTRRNYVGKDDEEGQSA